MDMSEVEFGEGRKALSFGQQRINLYLLVSGFYPKALNVKEGSEGLCFIIDAPITEAIKGFEKKGGNVIEGPVARIGTLDAINSACSRDLDVNLIETSGYAAV